MSIFLKTFLGLIIILLFTNAISDPVPLEQAFQFHLSTFDDQTLIASWKIDPCCYIYRDRITFKIIEPKDTEIGNPLFPDGIIKHSRTLGDFEVYKNTVKVSIPILKNRQKMLTLQTSYQGCAFEGYCYPPVTKTASIRLNDLVSKSTESSAAAPKQEKNFYDQVLQGRNPLLLIIGFLGFGFLISLTPCCLPMIPILLAIITGQDKKTRKHSFVLAIIYVLGMATTYSIAGILFGYLGSSIQPLFQQTWIIILFSLLFVAMALSCFGFYSLQMPSAWQNFINRQLNIRPSGHAIGTFIMGSLSILILSPCVTPPLVGVLGYISQTGNSLWGGIALFTLGIGMGIPLLALGLLGHQFLPKAGNWMNAVKNFLGILLLAMAIWILQRILPSSVILLLFAILFISMGIYYSGILKQTTNKFALIKKIIGILFLIYGILLIIRVEFEHAKPPFPMGLVVNMQNEAPVFISIKNRDELNHYLNLGKEQNKKILVDFSAKWCISCSELENLTFSKPSVKKELANFILLRVDMITESLPIKEILKKYHIVAPPTLLFFSQGEEIKQARIIGFVNADDFVNKLKDNVAPIQTK